MGLTVSVPASDAPLSDLLARVRAAGIDASVMMLDGQLCAPNAALPATWREARLRTPAGTVTMKRAAGAIELVVFGNATPALTAVQAAIADALA